MEAAKDFSVKKEAHSRKRVIQDHVWYFSVFSHSGTEVASFPSLSPSHYDKTGRTGPPRSLSPPLHAQKSIHCPLGHAHLLCMIQWLSKACPCRWTSINNPRLVTAIVSQSGTSWAGGSPHVPISNSHRKTPSGLDDIRSILCTHMQNSSSPTCYSFPPI